MHRAPLLLVSSLLLSGSPPAQEEGPSPTPPAVPATASAGPVRMPLPPDFARDAVLVVKAGSMRSSFFGKPRPISIRPYAIRDLKTGTETRDAGSTATRIARFRTTIGVHWQNVENGFSFRVTDEADPPVELGRVACDWGVSQTSADASFRGTGVQVEIPGPSTLVCDIVTVPGEDPWEFHLWTDRTTNIVVPEFPSGGALSCGDVLYATASTNVLEPLGLPSPRMTGTLFLRDGRPVAAVERQLPGRILTLPSLDPAERSLFVAVGAAIFTFDFVSRSGSH